MNVLYLLVPLALMLAFTAAWAFRWAAHADQFEDLESPAVRLLDDAAGIDDDRRREELR